MSENCDNFAVLVIKSEHAKNLHIPQYEGLTVDDILKYSLENEAVRQHLPDERDRHKLPRQFVINVIYSLLGDPFRRWVSQEIKKRNDEMALKKDLIIELDPSIAAAFHESANISSKYHNLIL